MCTRKPAGLTEIEKLLGPDNVISASVVTRERGPRPGPEGCWLDDVVAFHGLAQCPSRTMTTDESTPNGSRDDSRSV